MEKFSKKRGRPRKIPLERETDLRNTHPDVTTRRSLNNKWHLHTAYRFLRPQGEKYQYLINRETNRLRRTILTALGRLGDDCETDEEAEHWISEAASRICEKRMKTSAALEYISDLRVLRRTDL